MDIEVIHIGIGTEHDENFVYSRPNGTGAWVFMYLPESLEIDTISGREISRVGDCILHDPFFAQMHRALPGGFCNDWIHFRGEGLPALWQECNLPINQLMRPGSGDFIRVVMHEVQREFETRSLHWHRRIAGMTTDLMLQLSRRIHTVVDMSLTRAEREHYVRICAVRQAMLSKVDTIWTVTMLARQANLSEPRFSALYRRFFNASPNDELIRARIDQAKFLLAHTSQPISSVAERCGFESAAYFSRTFQRHVGCPPRGYLRLPHGQSASG
jgi:AraC family transcriptional regulator, arabinose operon regulatory protein